MNLVAEEPVVFSVTEISNRLKQFVESNFSQIKVRGEISSYKLHTSGHSYFVLKDTDCILDAVMWRGVRNPSLLINDGLEVIATGKLTTYSGRSKYQMVVTHIEAAGQGALLKVLQELKIRLQKEGLFERKRELPKFPSVIGVITSPTGAVIRDILHRLSDRFPCHVLLWPVAVQGTGSAEQIAAAIAGFNKFPLRPDVLIVARGGGSLEDLWSFNEEIVVRSAFNSDIPIISAVGHETDTTLIDFASDKRAPTPTAAAEFATPDQQHIKLFLGEVDNRLQRLITQLQERYRLLLENFSNRIPDLPSIVMEKNQRLDEWFERYQLASTVFLNRYQQKLDSIKVPLVVKNVEQLEVQLNNISQLFMKAFGTFFYNKEQAFKWHSMLLNQNSYQRTLEKGFCLVEGKAAIVTSAKELKTLDEASINFADGKVKVRPIRQRTMF